MTTRPDGAAAKATTLDETFAWIGGSFGELQIGAHDDASSAMHYGQQDVGIGMNAGDIKVWIPVVGSSTRTAGTATARASSTTRLGSAAFSSALPMRRMSTTPKLAQDRPQQ